MSIFYFTELLWGYNIDKKNKCIKVLTGPLRTQDPVGGQPFSVDYCYHPSSPSINQKCGRY